MNPFVLQPVWVNTTGTSHRTVLCSGTTTQHGADGDGRPTSGENRTSRSCRHKVHIYDSERKRHHTRRQENPWGLSLGSFLFQMTIHWDGDVRWLGLIKTWTWMNSAFSFPHFFDSLFTWQWSGRLQPLHKLPLLAFGGSHVCQPICHCSFSDNTFASYLTYFRRRWRLLMKKLGAGFIYDHLKLKRARSTQHIRSWRRDVHTLLKVPFLCRCV